MIDPDIFLNFLKQRRSIRKYQDTIIPDEAINMILDKISKIAIYGRFIKKAPLLIAIIGKIKQNPNWYVQDTSLVSMNMMLMAWSLGIGTCWIGSMDRDKVKEFLGLGKDDFILTVLPFGYIEGNIPKPTLRKELKIIIRTIE